METVLFFLLGVLLTWGIGLSGPLLLRYAIIRRPIGGWPAVLICIVWALALAVIFSALGSTSKSHAALVLIVFSTYWILRGGSGGDSVKRKTEDGRMSEKARQTEESGSTVSGPLPANIEEAVYETALAEIKGESRRKGLWAKALSESLGDEKKAEALYIRYRVTQLTEEQQRQKQAEEKARAAEAARKAKEEADRMAVVEQQRRRDVERKVKKDFWWALSVLVVGVVVIIFICVKEAQQMKRETPSTSPEQNVVPGDDPLAGSQYVGMTVADMRKELGKPRAEMSIGKQKVYRYPGMDLIAEDGVTISQQRDLGGR